MKSFCAWFTSVDWHKRIMEFAALATVATVGFAAYQILSDREVRLIEARLKAIELIVPRFSFELEDQLERYRTAEDLDASNSFSIDLDLEAFNESGLTFKIAAFGQRCVEDLDVSAFDKFLVDTTVGIAELFPPLEGPLTHRISKGKSELTLSLAIDPTDLAKSNVHVTIMFYDLTVAESVLQTVGEAFESYDDELVLKGIRDEFVFDVLLTADTDEEAFSLSNCELGDQADFETWKAKVQSGDISAAGIY